MLFTVAVEVKTTALDTGSMLSRVIVVDPRVLLSPTELALLNFSLFLWLFRHDNNPVPVVVVHVIVATVPLQADTPSSARLRNTTKS